MKKELLFLVLAIPLMSCVRSPRPTARAEDPSIVFPHFHEQAAVQVGAQDSSYELDGSLLRALTLAANDFLPPDAKRPACWDRQESHRYRVIRQADIIFVRIDEAPEACGQRAPALHSGASYAISQDGRILRSLIDGQPDGSSRPTSGEAGDEGVSAKPGVSSQSPEFQGEPRHVQPPSSEPDAGFAPGLPAPVPLLDGGPEAP